MTLTALPRPAAGAVRQVLLPRQLHPGAWWVWALGLATAASRTTNPLLLALIISVAGYVVVCRRTDAPWARSYRMFLTVALVVIAIRVVFATVFGAPVEGATVLVTLPEVPLPDFFAGIRLGGAVSLEGLAAAAYEGLRIGTLLVCVGAANSLANPTRLLRSVPGALYEVGVAVIVAMTFAPQLVASVGRVRAARRLRGRSATGLSAVRGVAMPVLSGALEHSLALAAAMDSRGYGRRTEVGAAARRITGALVLAGLLGIAAALYGLLGGDGPALARMPLLVVGCAVAALGLTLGGRRTSRSRYRPDPWSLPEWAVAGSGIAAAGALILAASRGDASITPSTIPLLAPTLSVLTIAGVLVALLPAWCSPPPPRRGSR